MWVLLVSLVPCLARFSLFLSSGPPPFYAVSIAAFFAYSGDANVPGEMVLKPVKTPFFPA
jgi:hypothetical protein